jgi:hypothetical protein
MPTHLDHDHHHSSHHEDGSLISALTDDVTHHLNAHTHLQHVSPSHQVQNKLWITASEALHSNDIKKLYNPPAFSETSLKTSFNRGNYCHMFLLVAAFEDQKCCM